MIKANYLVHDSETGSLEYETGPITEYAAIVLDGSTFEELDRFHCFVQPYHDLKITQESLKRTMVSMTDIKNGLKGDDFVKGVIDFYKKWQGKSRYKDANRLISVGHNVVFDNEFMEYAFILHGKNIWWELIQNVAIDTQVLAKMMWGLTGDEKIRLIDCCTRAGISLTDAHGAMNDTEATVNLLRFFMGKLRSASGEGLQSKVKERKKGKDFFEFTYQKK